jgi:glycosyltransferase involved in cell wall biosynthesis
MSKKKILLLSDDLRLTSGIATVSRDIVLGTVGEYDWVQVGAAINHPDKGKVLDLSEDCKNITGVDDASVRIYCNDGYGDSFLIRKLIKSENPDAILHFTDPRFWGWLYNMEHEIRTNIPLLYLNIWDGAGLVGGTATDPSWNKEAYASCDLLMAISKQTYGINHRVLNKFNQHTDKGRITYVPHGINTSIYHPINENETEQHHQWNEYVKENEKFRGNNPNRFIVMWNNRNIHRKHPADVILAYKHMCMLVDENGGDAKNDCLLYMHTNPVDQNGTDLFAVINALCQEYPVMFSEAVNTVESLNIKYNIADVVLNMASNEGFGLATAEALSAGTPIVVNVTGGLQDQCGFINPKTNKYFTADDYLEIHTLNDRRKWSNLKHGEWVKPIWPSNLSIQGSIPTPYIFDDRADYRDVGDALYEWYKMPKENRKECGLKGRQYILNSDVGMSRENMAIRIIDSVNTTLSNFEKREKFELFLV